MKIENSLVPGTILKSNTYKYKIEKVLGQGSFGITYLTIAEYFKEQNSVNHAFHVTIKEFFMKDINDREGTSVTSSSNGGLCDKYKNKFVQEVLNLQKLIHPNIVCVIDFFEENNTYYYAMDYLCGGDLDTLIKRNIAINERDALVYVRQIGDALSYMHNHKMLHLDLKPSNVMLNVNGEAVVIDFGLSKQYDDNGNPETSTTIGGGTPGYAPIEQSYYHGGLDFPQTMDVYALGATMFKMLTGVRPPEASEILNEGFPETKLRSHNVSSSIISVVKKAMSPKKQERYQSVDSLLREIEMVGLASEKYGDIIDVKRKRDEKRRTISKKGVTLAEIIKLGDDAYSRKDYFTAVNWYMQAFSRDPSLGEIAYTIGEIYYHGRDEHKKENVIGSRYQGAIIYARVKKASVWFRRAIDLGVDNSAEFLEKAAECKKRKDYKSYFKFLGECVVRNYKSKEGLALLADAYEKGIGCKADNAQVYYIKKRIAEIEGEDEATVIYPKAPNRTITDVSYSKRENNPGCLSVFFMGLKKR